MCLDNREQLDPPIPRLYAWMGVVTDGEFELYTPFRLCAVPLGVKVKAKHRLGLHAFKTRAGARAWRQNTVTADCSHTRVVRVLLEKVTHSGTFAEHPCYEARYRTALKVAR